MIANAEAGFLRSPRRAFSMLEFLLVLVTLAILSALVMTGLQRARAAADRADCQNHLRQQATAILNYEARTGRLPPGSISGPFPLLKVPEDVNHGLWTVVLPELAPAAAAMTYHWQFNFDDPNNQPVVQQKIAALYCPTHKPRRLALWPDDRYGEVSDYAPVEVNPFLADLGLLDHSENFDGPLPVNGKVRMSEITDGAAHTLLVVEAAGRPGAPWCSPDIPVSVRFIQGGSAHFGGANVAMCDGSVRFLGNSVDLRLIAKLATRAGNESHASDW